MSKDYKEEVKNLIKGHITLRGLTITDVAKELKKQYGRSDNMQNLSQKINNSTIKFVEVLEILDLLGYEFKISDKNK